MVEVGYIRMAARLTDSQVPLVAPPASSSSVRAVMMGNRQRDTKPEMRLRSALHGRGLRFRKQYPIDTSSGVVRVDIAFPRVRLAVFVDGCFWHGCPTHGTTPRTNTGYWEEKLHRNALRDVRNDAALAANAWHVVRIWEHTDVASAAQTVEAAISKLTALATC